MKELAASGCRCRYVATPVMPIRTLSRFNSMPCVVVVNALLVGAEDCHAELVW